MGSCLRHRNFLPRTFWLIATFFGGLAGASEGQPTRQVVDRIVAVIDDQIITQRELEAKAAPFMQGVEHMADAAARAKKQHDIYLQVLNIEIGERIVARELEHNKSSLGVTDKDVERAVEEVLRINHLTYEQLQAALFQQGLTWAEYRTKLRAQIERARLVQYKVQGRVAVNDNDVKRRCLQRQRLGKQDQQVCASHILFHLPDNAAQKDIDALHAKASQLQSELRSGGDFAAFAMKYSDDKGAPDGKLGCFGRGEMVEPFEKAAFALPVGEVSAVVRTTFGLHIIKVYDRRSGATADCDDAAQLEPYRNELYQEEMQRQMEVWVQELRKKAFVDVRL